MTIEQVDFYLLDATDKAARFTVACRIANKAFGQGLTVYLQTDDVAHCEMLDRQLWTFSQESYVPHAISQSGSAWDKYPIQIGVGDIATENIATQDIARKNIDLLISLSGSVPGNALTYRRVADLILNSPEEKQFGRQRFKYYRDQGIEPRTHSI